MSYIIWKPEEDVHPLTLFMKTLDKKQLKTAFIISLFLRELTWLHTNPSIYCEERFRNIPDLYFAKDKNTSLRNIKIIKRALGEKNSKITFIRGEKGSGKTFSLGYLLNKETRALNKRGITWFRVDATKIYELYYTYPNIFNTFANKKILLESYLYSQIFFVFSRYHNTDDVLKIVDFNKVIEETAKEAALKLKKSAEEIKEILLELKNKAFNASKFDNSLNGKPWIQLYSEEYFTLLKIFSQKLLNSLKEQKKQVVLFLDGIDNIDYDLEHLEFVLEEVYNLLWGDNVELQSYFSKIVLLSRPEIYEKIVSNVKIQLYNIEVWDLKPVPIEVLLAHISSLLNKQWIEELSKVIFEGLDLENIVNIFNEIIDEFIENSSKESFKDINWNDLNFKFREKILEKFSINREKLAVTKVIKAGYIIILILTLMKDYSFQKFLEDFIIYKKYFLSSFKQKTNEISKFLEEKYQHKLIDKEKWLKIFGGNVRDTFLSLFYSYLYIRAYINARKFPYSSIKDYFEASDFSYRQDIREEVKNRRLKIILEATFKFGKKYAPWVSDKTYIPPYSSFPFLNFFNPSYVSTSNISPFYSLLVIDKLLKIKKYGFTISKDELLSKIIGNKDLNLKNEFEKKILSPLIEFGYISIKANNSITLTSKGIFAFCSFLTDINIITLNIFYGLFNNKISEKIFSLEKPPFKTYPEIWQGYLSTSLYNFHTLLAYLYEETQKLQWFDRFKKLINNSYIKQMLFEFEKFLELNEREKAFYEFSLNRLKNLISNEEILHFLQETFYEKEKKEEENIIAMIGKEIPIVLKELIDLEWNKFFKMAKRYLDIDESLNIFKIYKLFKIPKAIATLELYKFIGSEKYKILKEQYENIYGETSNSKQDIFSFGQSLYLYIRIKEKIINYYKEFQKTHNSKEMDLDSFLEWLKKENIINPF